MRAGVAPRRVRRLIAEWQAHHTDLSGAAADAGAGPAEAALLADQQLGDDATLLRACLNRPELLSVTHRHPRLMFGVVPPLLFALVFVVLIAILVQALDVLHAGFGITLTRSSPAERMVTITFGFLLWVLPALVVGGIAHGALRQRARRLWPLIGMLAVALVGAATNLGVQWSASGVLSSLSGGIGVSTERVLELLARVAPAGVIVVAYLWRRRSVHAS